MHEASLAQGLLELVLNTLEDFKNKNPESAKLKLKEIVCGAGLFAGFEDSTLRSCFEMFAEDTPCEGANLKIDIIPLDCVCRECGKEFQLIKKPYRCPSCGSDELDFSGGSGLTLMAINVDSENEQ